MGDRPPGLPSPAGGSHLERSTTSAGDVGSGDGEDRLQDARNLAWRALNRRDRTLAELRETLKAKGCESDAVEHVLSELSELGYLDDADYARRFAEDRRRLDAWGRERIARRLQVLGVAAEHIAAALDEQDADTELQRALELLIAASPLSPTTGSAHGRSECSCAAATTPMSPTRRCGATHATDLKSEDEPLREERHDRTCRGLRHVRRGTRIPEATVRIRTA